MKNFLSATITIIIIFSIGFFTGQYLKKPKIIERDKIQYKTVYVKQPHTIDDYKTCFDSPILINSKLEGYTMHIFAHDECKESKADIMLEVNEDSNFKYYIGAGVGAGVIAGLVYLIK